MATLCNPVDYKRFTRLAEYLSQLKPPVEISVYVGSDHNKGSLYVSLDIKGDLPRATVEAVLFDEPLPGEASAALDEAIESKAREAV